MVSVIAKAGYAAKQGARVAWYMGHYLAARRNQTAPLQTSGKPFRPTSPVISRERMLGDMAFLFRRDLANVENGVYPMPDDDDGDLRKLLNRSRHFFRDLSGVDRRRREGNTRDGIDPDLKETMPSYYLQNFHYQTGGYLTEESADLYDMQVEVLFSGSANAMRRQALVPLASWIRGRDQRELAMLDLACGTGRFLKFVKQTWPRLNVTGIDLSQAYLDEAEVHLTGRSACSFLQGNGEEIPLGDASQDIVTCIYLFHELPPRVRRIVAQEIARVLKPGGLFVFVDSLQFGDQKGYDGLLEAFDVGFHEPYFESYVTEDFQELFMKKGLVHLEARPAFLSKVMSFQRT